MTTQIKEIIAETRRLEKEATPAEWRMAPKHCIYAQITSDADDIVTIGDSQSICMADAEFAIFTRNNITAILDYVAKLEKKVTEISSGYRHCQAAFALLDEKYRNRKVKA